MCVWIWTEPIDFFTEKNPEKIFKEYRVAFDELAKNHERKFCKLSDCITLFFEEKIYKMGYNFEYIARNIHSLWVKFSNKIHPR